MSDRNPSRPATSGVHEVPRLARTLGRVLEHARLNGAVRRADLAFGDRVVVRTTNSVYSLWSQGGDSFTVSGGWFDRNGGPLTVSINGCTYGGTLIRHDVVAAPGLFLEFGNGVCTTRIRDVRVVRWDGAEPAH
jgi:hypothetical protein